MYIFKMTFHINIFDWMSFVAVFLSTNELGYPYKLNEKIEETNENSSVCYGHHTTFKPSCAHLPGTVIGIQALKVGAKPSSLRCSEEVDDTKDWNGTCCSPNISENECIQKYDYTHSDLELDYKFHKYCSGFAECKEAAQAVRAHSKCENRPLPEFMPYTNYMFMEYACIDEERIGRLCSNETYNVNATRSPFYLQSPGYPSSINTTNLAACTCHVEATATVNIYMLDLRLYGQTFSIYDSYTSDTYTMANATVFNVTKINKSEESWITFENISYGDESYVWIGFEATNSMPFSITCAPIEAGVTGSTPAEAAVTDSTLAEAGVTGSTLAEAEVTDSTLVETGVTGSNEPKYSTVEPPCNEYIVAGIVTGSLLIGLGILLLLCYLYKRKHRKSDDQQKITEETNPNLQKASERVNIVTEFPMNKTFKPSKIPSNKVEPTRYIEEHGGLGATPLPNISEPVTEAQSNNLGLETSAQPKHLPPLDMFVLMDTKADKQENIPDEPKKKKKRKKHKKHARNGDFGIDLETNPEQANSATNECEERKHTRRTKKKNRSSVLPISENDHVADEAMEANI